MRRISELFSRLRTTVLGPRRVVYTCLFGSSEYFNDFVYEGDGNIDFVCFTDDPELTSEFWTIKVVEPGLLDPARAAKRVKALPHLYLPEYDWSLYIDNIIRLKTAPKQLFDQFLVGAPSPLVCFRHPERNCVYEEAEKVIELSFDNPDRVRTQMMLYRQLGYPVQNGLAKSGFLLRRHHDPTLTPVMERWHDHVLGHSKRDQLSMNPVMWFHHFTPTYLHLNFYDFDLLDWPVIKDDVRLPRDFEDAPYLKLHPDVTDARRHYLQVGAQERRRYK
ncbi:MAG: hypothetical protein QOF19_1274 [Alphaproteobacteria bacterium]|jgi:hypothetical protein|nr:hypothetical protein [Alphaproteobacteria bacterium]